MPMFDLIIRRLLMEVLEEVSRKHITDAIDKLVSNSNGTLEKQKLNRIRNVGNLTNEEFVKLIASTFSIPENKIEIKDPVTDRSTTDYESSFYSTFVFTPPPEKEGDQSQEVSIILTDPRRSQANREKQERGIIDAINSVEGLKIVNSVNDVTIRNVVRAEKSTAKGENYPHQPYADIDLIIKGKEKPVKISAKSFSVPSSGGAGLAGIIALENQELLDFVKKFYGKVLELAKAGDTGDKYVEIPADYLEAIFEGNVRMGGPVDYYYKGSMTVSSTVTDNTIRLDGELLTVQEYAAAHKYYFRIAKRKKGGTVTDKIRDTIDIPIIYLDDNGKVNSRLLVTNTVPSGATELKLS